MLGGSPDGVLPAASAPGVGEVGATVFQIQKFWGDQFPLSPAHGVVRALLANLPGAQLKERRDCSPRPPGPQALLHRSEQELSWLRLLWDLRIKPLNYEMYVDGGILWSADAGGERCRTRSPLRLPGVGWACAAGRRGRCFAEKSAPTLCLVCFP